MQDSFFFPHADGYVERDAALLMLAEKQKGRSRRITVYADKAYDTKEFHQHGDGVQRDAACYQERPRPHQQPGPRNHAPARLCHQAEPPMADRKGFGWLKQTGPLRQVKLRGLGTGAAHNLIRLPKLIAQPPARLREQCA